MGERTELPSDLPHREVPMRFVVLTLAVVSALTGALLSGKPGPVQVEADTSDTALFV